MFQSKRYYLQWLHFDINVRYALQNKFNESLSHQIQNKQTAIFPNWICTVINNYQQ